MADRTPSPLGDPLTPRELEILRLITDGLSNQAIAERLFITLGTVKWYLKQIYSKLHVGSRTQAIALARTAGLLDELATAHTPIAPLHNLPYQATPFIGRTGELTALAEQLTDPACRLLTVVGPGGVGKTRLVIEAATAQLAGFRDGVYFVALAPLIDPTVIPTAIAEAIGLAFVPGLLPKNQLFNYLRNRQMLMVLDNFEHLMAGVSLIVELLQHAPRITLLVTSRERLHLQNEVVIRLDGFDYEDWTSLEAASESNAGKLFLQSARHVKPSLVLMPDSLEVLSSICRLVGGMPLGILLAAAWIDTLSLAEIAEELQRSFAFLEGDWRDLPERQRSLRAVFDHSWRLLTETERLVMGNLSVFRGGFTREAAQYVAQASLKTLTGLVNKSLLSRDDAGRFDMHELLRQYAEQALAVSLTEYERAHEQHCAYFADFMERQWLALRSEKMRVALAEIEREIDNVRAAWNWMMQSAHYLFIHKTAHALGCFFERRAWAVEGVALFGKAVDALKAKPASQERDPVLAKVLAWCGRSLFYADAHPREKDILQESLAILHQYRDVETTAIAYWQLCLTTLVSAEFVELKRLAEEGVRLIDTSSDMWSSAILMYLLASAAYFLGEYEPAQRIGEQALQAAETVGDPYLRGLIHGQVLGFVALKTGHFEEAKWQFNRSIALHELVGSRLEKAMSFRDVAAAYAATGDYANGRLYYQRSMRLFHENGFNKLLVSCLIAVAKVLTAQGFNERAVELLALVIVHPETYPSDVLFAKDALTGLRDKLLPAVFAAAYQRGTALNLDVVVAELCEADQ